MPNSPNSHWHLRVALCEREKGAVMTVCTSEVLETLLGWIEVLRSMWLGNMNLTLELLAHYYASRAMERVMCAAQATALSGCSAVLCTDTHR